MFSVVVLNVAKESFVCGVEKDAMFDHNTVINQKKHKIVKNKIIRY